jgi:hypothetical protein
MIFMKELFFIFLLYFLLNAELLPYFSPGISISWSKHTTVVGWKLSFGYFQDVYRNNINGYFLNVTFGKKYGIDNDLYSYWYSELESGMATGLLFSGAGFGTAYLKDKSNKTIILPKASIFTGDILFLRSDLFMYQNKMFFDIGGNIVLPLNKYILNPPGIGRLNIGDS